MAATATAASEVPPVHSLVAIKRAGVVTAVAVAAAAAEPGLPGPGLGLAGVPAAPAPPPFAAALPAAPAATWVSTVQVLALLAPRPLWAQAASMQEQAWQWAQAPPAGAFWPGGLRHWSWRWQQL